MIERVRVFAGQNTANIVTWVLASTIYYVKTSGSDSNNGLSPSSSFLTISKGVSVLHPGDVLFVFGGLYTGNLNRVDSAAFVVPSGNASQPITIQAYPGDTVIIQPPRNVPGIKLDVGNPAYLSFGQLKIDMANEFAGDNAECIFIDGGNHITFQNVEWYNGKSFGFHSGTTSGFLTVQYCTAHNIGYAGDTDSDGHAFYISGNDGLYEHNEVYSCTGYGFHVFNNAGPTTAPSRNIVRKNNIHDNGAGHVTEFGIVFAWGSDNLAYDNLIWNNLGGVLAYTNSQNAMFYNNTIYNNTHEGVAMQFYLTRPDIRNNIVYNNGQGIVDYGGTGTPIITPNTLVNPSFVNAGAADFRLQAGSVAIGAGDTIAVVPDDYLSLPRTAPYDNGAYRA